MSMNAVGIDVSKRKSTVAILRPGGEVVASQAASLSLSEAARNSVGHNEPVAARPSPEPGQNSHNDIKALQRRGLRYCPKLPSDSHLPICPDRRNRF